ncbi:MAG: hypothetical protein AB9866_14860 [Syntrophobacteraceae bacterium]
MRNRLLVSLFCLFLALWGCASKKATVDEGPRAAISPAAAPTVAPAAVAAGTPVVEVPETNFDFGVVTDGNDYTHAFVIRNAGTGVLEIKKVLPG